MGTQYRLLTLFADGGWMMYPLVLCSLIALGVIIAKFWTLWLAHKDTHRVLTEVEEAAMAGDIDGAYENGSSSLYVSSGLGTSLARLRFACRPEIVLLTLTSA